MSCSPTPVKGYARPLIWAVMTLLSLLWSQRALADLGMQASNIPLWKALDQPFFSLDGSHVELFSLIFLFMITVVVMSVRRRRQLVRHVVQVISLIVFFYVVFSCLGVFGMIRNTLHGITLIGTVYTESFFWMSLPVCVLAFSLTTGPFFCGWICPTGTIQEFFTMGRELVTGKRPIRPTPLNLALIGLFYVGFLYLVFSISRERKLFMEDSSLYWASATILISFLVLTRLAADTPTRSLRWISFGFIILTSVFKTIVTSPVHFAFVDVFDPASAITTGVLAVASIFIGRAWCRYVCPWGQLMSLLHRFSRLKVRRTTTGVCDGCGSCDDACRVGAVKKGNVSTEHCQFCFACVDICPNHSIEIVDDWLPRGTATAPPAARLAKQDK